jgi:type VI secretion system protein ImpG
MLPISLTNASLMGLPFSSPGAKATRGAQSVLTLSFETFDPDLHFSDIDFNKIRLMRWTLPNTASMRQTRI